MADKKNVVAISNYGFDFDAVVSHGNIHGVQCHIEKSHHWGEQLLKNFVEL
jgi:glutamine amidotransferase